MKNLRHFLNIDDIDREELYKILKLAFKIKKEREKKRKSGKYSNILQGCNMVMIFEENSTRTRVSFESGVNELGGNAIYLKDSDTQIGRGESIEDTAKVLSRYADLILFRACNHEALLRLAKSSRVPVINGLTEKLHPCQIMADLMTIEERFGDIKNQKVAWIGDGNNMANSWINAAIKFGFELRISCPQEYSPSSDIINKAKSVAANISFFGSAKEAVKDVKIVTTDTWRSMGQKIDDNKMNQMREYQVNDGVMAMADSEAVFMHCLPAHRGEEVTETVIDGVQSVVFDEAENRLHVQKAIMLWCLNEI